MGAGHVSLETTVNRVGSEFPRCLTCGKLKAPRGRSLPMEMSGSYCQLGDDCEGYSKYPEADTFFPGELVTMLWLHGDDLDEVRELLKEVERLRAAVHNEGNFAGNDFEMGDCYFCDGSFHSGHLSSCAWLIENQRVSGESSVAK